MDGDGINWLKAVLMMAWDRVARDGILGFVFWYAAALPVSEFYASVLLDIEFKVAFGSRRITERRRNLDTSF